MGVPLSKQQSRSLVDPNPAKMEKINNSDTSMDLDNTKGHNAEVETSSHTQTSLDDAPHFDATRTKALLRKLDWHLVPFLSLLYLLSFLDRTNIGNAKLFNLLPDLNIPATSLQYNNALAIFFPFYVAAEIPSNMMMKRLRPSLWLTIIMVAWAICTICMGFVHNYAGLMAARVFLGIAELDCSLVLHTTSLCGMLVTNVVSACHSFSQLLLLQVHLVVFSPSVSAKWTVLLAAVDGLGSSSWRVLLLSSLPSLLTGLSTIILELLSSSLRRSAPKSNVVSRLIVARSLTSST